MTSKRLLLVLQQCHLYLVLLPVGFSMRLLLPIQPVCSYHTFSPLPCYGGLFSVALSLGSPPPGVTWHRVFVEPGLSSLKKIKAISLLSGKSKIFIKIKISSKFYILIFANLLIINKHSWSILPLISSDLNLL